MNISCFFRLCTIVNLSCTNGRTRVQINSTCKQLVFHGTFGKPLFQKLHAIVVIVDLWPINCLATTMDMQDATR